jgi:hypothetical protein
MSHSHFAHTKETMRMRKFSHIHSHIFSHDKQCEYEGSGVETITRARAGKILTCDLLFFSHFAHPYRRRETRISQTNRSQSRSAKKSRPKYLDGRNKIQAKQRPNRFQMINNCLTLSLSREAITKGLAYVYTRKKFLLLEKMERLPLNRFRHEATSPHDGDEGMKVSQKNTFWRYFGG